MLYTPIYDPHKTFEENFKEGPFGDYADGKVFSQEGEPTKSFFGNPVYLPFGIPAGPIPTSRHAKGGFEKGYDLLVYKTVRSTEHPCNPMPNVIPVQVSGDLTLEKRNAGIIAADDFTEPLAITNSFGVPSYNPDVWQPDMKQAMEYAGKGQLLIGSFQGTNKGEGADAFIEDHVTAAKLVQETGVKVMEVNFSCPNEGTGNLLCFDIPRVITICGKIKEAIGNTPLLIKLAYFEDETAFRTLVTEVGNVIDGFSLNNSMGTAVRNVDGSQAIPGEGRLVSGVCGAPIKWAGLEMVKRAVALRNELNMKFTIVGVGGVTKPVDYVEYITAGADAVMSATGTMWNPYLAQEIKTFVKEM